MRTPSPRRRPLRRLALGSAVGLAAALGTAHAEDAPPAPEVRCFDVLDLVRARPSFTRERGPYPALPDEVNDERQPLFGGERDEGTRPLGGPDELVDLLKATTGAAGAWDAEGTSIATDGPWRLVVAGPPPLLAAVAEVLDGLRARLLATYAVDVAVFAGDPSTVADADLVGRIGRGLTPLAVARASALAGARVVGFDGRQTAYVQDYDVEVAQEAKVGDPIVGVMSTGLAFDARVGPAGDRLRLEVNAWWAQPAGMGRASPPETSRIDLPLVDAATTAATVDVTPGAWVVLPSRGVGASGYVFAARVTPTPFDAGTPTPALVLRPVPVGTPGPLRVELLDVADLRRAAPNRRGRETYVAPSNYTPPSPPELAEPAPRFALDRALELIKAQVAPAYFDGAEGAALDLRAGLLFVRADETRHRAIAATLAAIRAATAPTTRVRAVSVAVPAAALPELWTGLDGALLSDGGAALLARPGVRVLERASLRLVDAQRDAVDAGRVQAVVADYDVEIAQAATIGNPIVRHVFSGTTLDVDAGPAGGGGAVLLDVRWTRSASGSVPKAPTNLGDVELPSLRLFRHRGSLTMRSGTTRVLSVGLEGGDVVVTLLSAVRE